MTGPHRSAAPSPAPPDRTSDLLRHILDEVSEPTVRVGHIVRKLRRRSFGGLFILLAILGLLPGISLVDGLAMIIPAIQLALGMRAPLLPHFVRMREINIGVLRSVIDRLMPWIERMERRVKPRWPVLSTPPMPNLIGTLIIGLALVVVLPLPFSNMPPAIALVCLALGILERDGLMILLGVIIGLVALAIGVGVAFIALEGSLYVFRQYLGIP